MKIDIQDILPGAIDQSLSTADLKWLGILGLHLASTYVKRERTPEMMFSWPDPRELNDLCEEALASPNLRPGHRHAILVVHQVMQGILLLDQTSARTEAEELLRGKIELRNVKLDPRVVASIPLSDLKWLTIRGIILAVDYIEGDKAPAEIYGRMDPYELNDACEAGLVSPSLNPDHRHAIMIAYQAMQALLLIDQPWAQAKARERLGMEQEQAEAA